MASLIRIIVLIVFVPALFLGIFYFTPDAPIGGMKEHLKLKTEPQNIVGHLNQGNDVKYAYKTHKLEDERNEVKELRDTHSRTYKINENTFQKKIISEPQYWEDSSGEWWQVEQATTTKEAFDEQTRELGDIGGSGDPIYPDSGAGGPTGDGYAYRYTAAGEDWASMEGGAGNGVNNTDATADFARWITHATNTTFIFLFRGLFTFNTNIGTGATISSATFSLKGLAKDDPNTDGTALNLYGATPSANYNFVAGDFNECGTDAYATAIAYADYATGSYNTWTLNATGIAAIVKDGITAFCTRESVHDVGGDTPNTAANKDTFFSGYFSDTADTTSDPYLTLTYTIATESADDSDIMEF